jgi:hypothetical protein
MAGRSPGYFHTGDQEVTMQKIDEHTHLSEQDYGPWLDKATLYEDSGQFILFVEGGYSIPYEEEWYKLDQRPSKPLKELLTGELWAAGGDSTLLEEKLEVGVVETEPPE